MEYFAVVHDRKYELPGEVSRFIVWYQQPDTALADSCVYGVVLSSMYRFSKRNSRETDFVAAVSRMVRKMVEMGYDVGKVKAKVRRFVREVPHLFYSNRGRVWTKEIMDVINDAREQRQRERNRDVAGQVRSFMRSLEMTEGASEDT